MRLAFHGRHDGLVGLVVFAQIVQGQHRPLYTLISAHRSKGIDHGLLPHRVCMGYGRRAESGIKQLECPMAVASVSAVLRVHACMLATSLRRTRSWLALFLAVRLAISLTKSLASPCALLATSASSLGSAARSLGVERLCHLPIYDTIDERDLCESPRPTRTCRSRSKHGSMRTAPSLVWPYQRVTNELPAQQAI